ncbi:MAG: hypothetical protein QOE54_3469 [Streptosporangiaceae bacterium]|jgi:hypothetical protein|nr:Cysteinyl-tRNA synthetase-like protein [Streptosporangiaceae bacterium]MDX6431103.1 hypothetical protein [Streptosporangiaceae bacterium]
MLRLYDERTGRVSDITCARPGRLVLRVNSGEDLRGQVLGDLIRRFCERQRLRVFAFMNGSTADLNIRPGLDGDPPGADLGVGDVSSRMPAHRQIELGGTAPLPRPDEVQARGLDPLALRLVILRCHYREPLDPSWADLEDADADLREWRAEMAGWAKAPGKPMSSGYVAEADSALSDDLNVPRALHVLRQLATDPAVPPGAKFESFLHLDLTLALDLVRDIGR